MAAKASNDPLICVTGVPRLTNIESSTSSIPYSAEVPLRYEISKLYTSDDPIFRRQWTLFVLALAAFKDLPVDDPSSYFQIAGIHGYPMTSWNGVEEPDQDPENLDALPPGKDEFGGYCNHNSITFPTWHRVYLLLYEQCIWQHMKDIVLSWNLTAIESEIWNNAADTWRLPYWDWAREFLLPEAVTREEVDLFLPFSQTSRYSNPFPNPLRGFNNPEKDEHGHSLPFGSMPPGKRKWNIADNKNNKPPLPWSKCSGTSRYGVDVQSNSQELVGTEGRVNVKAAHDHMSKCYQHWYSPFRGKQQDSSWAPPSDLSDAVSRMFDPACNATWGTFASTKWWQESEMQGPGYMSLEYIHNNVHNLSGGNKFSKDGGQGIGHMQDVPVAAFDPLFWLHHCNIDRLTAMWQCLNWDLWWDKPEPDHPKLAGGNISDPLSSDSLLPFRTQRDPDVFWNSDDVRDWTRLNYQYDDLVPSSDAVLPNGMLDEYQYQHDLRESIDLAYPSTQSTFRDLMEISGPRDLITSNTTVGEYWTDYVLDVVYDRYALQGSSYTIQFYFQDGFSETYAGHVYSLGGLPITRTSQSKTSCRNCKSQQASKVLSRAQVPLTSRLLIYLMQRSFRPLQSMDIETISRFLKEHLRYKFLRLGGEEASPDCFPTMSVRLWAGERASMPWDDQAGLGDTVPTVYKLIDMSKRGDRDVLHDYSLLETSKETRRTSQLGEVRARL